MEKFSDAAQKVTTLSRSRIGEVSRSVGLFRNQTYRTTPWLPASAQLKQTRQSIRWRTN